MTEIPRKYPCMKKQPRCFHLISCRQSEDIDVSPAAWDLVVTVGKEKYPVTTCWEGDSFTVEIDGETKMEINTDWLVGEPMMLASINGNDVTVQVTVCEGHA